MVWACHNCTGLSKTVLNGTVRRNRRKGRQRKLREDKIQDWMDLELRELVRRVEDSKKLCRLVVRLCRAPKFYKTTG